MSTEWDEEVSFAFNPGSTIFLSFLATCKEAAILITVRSLRLQSDLIASISSLESFNFFDGCPIVSLPTVTWRGWPFVCESSKFEHEATELLSKFSSNLCFSIVATTWLCTFGVDSNKHSAIFETSDATLHLCGNPRPIIEKQKLHRFSARPFGVYWSKIKIQCMQKPKFNDKKNFLKGIFRTFTIYIIYILKDKYVRIDKITDKQNIKKENTYHQLCFLLFL